MDYARMSDKEQGSTLYRLVTPLLEKAKYERRKAKNTGGFQITEILRDGQVSRAVYKTSRNRWFSMQPDANGGWKPLDDADALILVTVDNPDSPTAFQLYIFPADEVRRHLNAALAAWTEAGLTIGGFGVWVSLDVSDKAHHVAGSGIAEKYAPILTVQFDNMLPSSESDEPINEEPRSTLATQPVPTPSAGTIAEVLNAARVQIAALAGVGPDAVKLDVRIGS
jgi:hypothetical protein